MICPHCFQPDVDGECDSCGASMDSKGGLLSVINRDASDEDEDRLSVLADKMRPLEERLDAVRDDYMDGHVVDRFFKTRTVCWRFLVPSMLTGRGLVIGDHDEKVGLLLAEVLEEVHVVDDSVARLQALEAVAEAEGVEVWPLHGTIETLPYPPDAFDVIVVQCRADEVTTYLSELKSFLADGGSVLLLVDGWLRELGLTHPFGLGAPEGPMSVRLQSAVHGCSWRLSRDVRNAGLEVAKRYALLSTNRHENERVFEVESERALDWLVGGPGKAANTRSFAVARALAQLTRETGILNQCYPRYLLVCTARSRETGLREPTDAMLIAGKNRSTVVELGTEGIELVRKIPNSRRQAVMSQNADRAITELPGALSRTVPTSELRETKFGPEREEAQVSGTPLDQLLEPTPESVERYLDMVFNWIEKLQHETRSGVVSKRPAEIRDELTNERFGLTEPPLPERPIQLPTVLCHGDLFGSNIYVDEGEVSQVIDWEWAEYEGNPIADPGFFLLQLAEFVGEDFVDGFERLFLADELYAKRVRRRVKEYCDCVGVELSTFALFLPIGYLQRGRIDMSVNKRLDIDLPGRVQYVWERTKSISRSFEPK